MNFTWGGGNAHKTRCFTRTYTSGRITDTHTKWAKEGKDRVRRRVWTKAQATMTQHPSAGSPAHLLMRVGRGFRSRLAYTLHIWAPTHCPGLLPYFLSQGNSIQLSSSLLPLRYLSWSSLCISTHQPLSLFGSSRNAPWFTLSACFPREFVLGHTQLVKTN